MSELRERWECSGKCGLVVRNPNAGTIPAPLGWDLDAERCVRCWAEADPETAAEVLLLAGWKVTAVKEQVPRMTSGQIDKLREDLIESGSLKPPSYADPPEPKVRRKRKPAKTAPQPRRPREDPARAAAEKLLREDPAMTNKEIAGAVGGEMKQVGKWRRNIGLPTSEAVGREQAEAIITAQPNLSNADVKRQMRHPISRPLVAKLRRKLGIPPPTKNQHATVHSDR